MRSERSAVVTGVALVAEPGAFGTPVNVFFRFPDVAAAAGETEGLETHRFQRGIAGQDHQVDGSFTAARVIAQHGDSTTPQLTFGGTAPAIGALIVKNAAVVDFSTNGPVTLGTLDLGTYPSQPGVLAGSATVNVSGQITGQRLTEAWGQQVVVDNRPGAAGIIGSEIVANTTPDGFTLLMGAGGHNINPGLYRKLP